MFNDGLLVPSKGPALQAVIRTADAMCLLNDVHVQRGKREVVVVINFRYLGNTAKPLN
jgi:hypothetical protein